MKIYCISGLGADKRVFQYLKLKGHEFVYIDWIVPTQEESLESYALRLADWIDGSRPFGLLGISFGGMIALELAKHLKPDRLFIISSIVSRNEIPGRYRLLGRLSLHKILPFSLLKRLNILNYYFFGVKASDEKNLLRRILRDTDMYFLKWALNAILNWQNQRKVKHTRIHGDKDRILPIHNLNVQYIIQGGGHFMIVNKAEQIAGILHSELDNE